MKKLEELGWERYPPYDKGKWVLCFRNKNKIIYLTKDVLIISGGFNGNVSYELLYALIEVIEREDNYL